MSLQWICGFMVFTWAVPPSASASHLATWRRSHGKGVARHATSGAGGVEHGALLFEQRLQLGNGHAAQFELFRDGEVGSGACGLA